MKKSRISKGVVFIIAEIIKEGMKYEKNCFKAKGRTIETENISPENPVSADRIISGVTEILSGYKEGMKS